MGFPKKEGGFYALKCFSNVILRDKLAVKHKDKLKTFTELFFYKRPLSYMGEISQGVQSLNLMSYLSGVLRPFFGDLGLCYGKN